ncbi:MAG: hypothetical protein IPJ32_14260 [Sphingobacteriaceae bacterium]|nr:hypothetical protein [Sphingobacteriaceae bacterium]
MKALVFIISLFTLTAVGQTNDVQYDLPSPAGWGTEKIPFPISFAPSIEYKGMEEIRFTPGWARKDSADYWSYVFLWYLDGKQKIDAKTLEGHLKVYYEGLASATKSVPREKLIPVVVKNKVEKTFSTYEACFEGTVYMLDYMSQKPMTLNYKIRLTTCPGEEKTFVFFRLSPQPYAHQVWKGLDKVCNDFKCKK